MVKLTERQEQVLSLLVRGFENPAIAKYLRIKLVTVKWHIAEIYKQFNINSYRGLIALERRGELNYERKS